MNCIIKKICLLLFVAFAFSTNVYSHESNNFLPNLHNDLTATIDDEGKVYEAMLYFDKACTWYGASAGAYVEFICMAPGISAHPVCIGAKVLSLTCTVNNVATKLYVGSKDKALIELSGALISEVSNRKGTKTLKVIITSANKWKNILELIPASRKKK